MNSLRTATAPAHGEGRGGRENKAKPVSKFMRTKKRRSVLETLQLLYQTPRDSEGKAALSDDETVKYEIPCGLASGSKSMRKKHGGAGASPGEELGQEMSCTVKAFSAGVYEQIRLAFGIYGKAVVDALGVRRILGSILLGDLAGLSGAVSAGCYSPFAHADPSRTALSVAHSTHGQCFRTLLHFVVPAATNCNSERR